MSLATLLSTLGLAQWAATDLTGHPWPRAGWVELQRVNDPVASFSHVARSSWGLALGLTVVCFAVSLLALWSRSPRAATGAGLIVGGATSNALAAALHHGAVVDYVTLGQWLSVNAADAAIVVGVGLVLTALGETTRWVRRRTTDDRGVTPTAVSNVRARPA